MMMVMGKSKKDEEILIKKITTIYESISKLPSLSPSKETNHLFTELVLTCIPPSSIDISTLPKPTQAMRTHLINLCSQAESLLESHYSTLLSSFDRPLDHLTLFPYYSNYLQLSLLEFTLLSSHLSHPPSKLAFIGSGPLPLSSIVLATRHLPKAVFHNYDLDPAANQLAERLVRSDPDLASRMVFKTADLMGLTRTVLGGYDVVFLAALVGMGREEKVAAVEHLAKHMAAGATLVVRSAHGARAFLYPVVEPVEDLKGFEVLSVYHPGDDVINSVIVARKINKGSENIVMNCKCCELANGLHHLGGHGGMMEEVVVAIEGQPSS